MRLVLTSANDLSVPSPTPPKQKLPIYPRTLFESRTNPSPFPPKMQEKRVTFEARAML
jgi:hypothetical protein